jgi:hypothetical protein
MDARQMQRKQETQAAHARATKAAVAVRARGGRIVRKIAQGTLLAAGLAATHIGVAEIDERCPLFNPTLLDRLQAPITRYHE